MKDSERFQYLNSDKRKMKLQSFVELAKQITDSSICVINIIDDGYQWALADNETEVKEAPQIYSVCHDTLQKNGAHEIEDLSNQSRYKNLSYVKGIPWLRYYLGIKLTTSTGKDIGTISVLDSIPKRIPKKQKEQFKILAHAVMMTLESEFNLRNISGELDTFRDNLHKLNHDVRSPISGIIGMADLLIEDIEEVNIQAARDIKMIKESAQSIADIITGVLATWDGDKNNEKLLKSKTLSNLLEKIEAIYNPLAQNKYVTLSLKNQMDREIRVPYNFSVKLLRIIGNLVSNAIKFSPINGSVEVIFSGTSKRQQTFLNITVKNTGESLSSEQVTSFNNGNPVARSNGHSGEKSFGLGLQHVYQMVSEEGGSISIEAGKSSGTTTFSIILSLPQNEKDEEKKSVPYVLNSSANPTVNGKKQSPGLNH